MYDVMVELDIDGYFQNSMYYDWTTPVLRNNPKDFKDQLDAVDLGLLPEEIEEVGRIDLMKLFNLLENRRI